MAETDLHVDLDVLDPVEFPPRACRTCPTRAG
jgi:hypothetical protein